MIISSSTHANLIDYLHNHEEDIADGINDFGSLLGVFAEIMERKPNPSVTITKDELRFIQKRLNDIKESE